jgi:hypothetical protein
VRLKINIAKRSRNISKCIILISLVYITFIDMTLFLKRSLSQTCHIPILFTITLVLFSIPGGFSTICFDNYLPRVLGGNGGNTVYYSFDTDPSGNIIAGGSSTDSTVASSSSSGDSNPILVYY